MGPIRNITTDEVYFYLQSIDPSKSEGLNGISPRIIEIASPVIAQSFCHIINLSIMSTNFHSLLQKARVIPIFKQGDDSDPANHRPISILPAVSKIIKWHIVNECLAYLRVWVEFIDFIFCWLLIFGLKFFWLLFFFFFFAVEFND